MNAELKMNDCNKIKDLVDIEEISLVCLQCSKLLMCNVRYLVKPKIELSENQDMNLESSIKKKEFTNMENECTKILPSNIIQEKCVFHTNQLNSLAKCSEIKSILVKKLPNSNEIDSKSCCPVKKIVRFTDSIGLELVRIKGEQLDSLLFNKDSVKKIFLVGDEEDSESESDDFVKIDADNAVDIKFIWNILFEQPCIKSNFLFLLNQQNVLLESVYTGDNWVNGIVRVLNLTFNKHVIIRYTIDKWSTHKDIDAIFIQHSCDGFTDRFSFRFNIYDDLLDRDSNDIQMDENDNDLLFNLEFAICYKTDSNVYWDNNNTKNYIIQCCCNLIDTDDF